MRRCLLGGTMAAACCIPLAAIFGGFEPTNSKLPEFPIASVESCTKGPGRSALSTARAPRPGGRWRDALVALRPGSSGKHTPGPSQATAGDLARGTGPRRRRRRWRTRRTYALRCDEALARSASNGPVCRSAHDAPPLPHTRRYVSGSETEHLSDTSTGGSGSETERSETAHLSDTSTGQEPSSGVSSVASSGV